MNSRSLRENWVSLIDTGSWDVSTGNDPGVARLDMRGLTLSERQGLDSSNPSSIRNVVRGKRWSRIDFSSAELSGLEFFDSELVDCSFEKAKCDGIRFWATEVRDCSFKGADLRKSVFGPIKDGVSNRFIRCDFSKSDFRQTAHFAAVFDRCTFHGAKLAGVDFQVSRFSDCTFSGSLDEVIFYRSLPNRPEAPPNDMRNADFSGARLRHVEFRGLDLDSVKLPQDAEHVIVHPYRSSLEFAIAELQRRGDMPSREAAAYLEIYLKWAGPNQRVGVFNKRALADEFGEGGARLILDLLQQTGVN